MSKRRGVIQMAGQGVDDLICANVVVEENILAIVDDLRGGFGGGQWDAFLYRLADEEGVWGKRRLWQSGDGANQSLDTGGTGHLLALERRTDDRDFTMHPALCTGVRKSIS